MTPTENLRAAILACDPDVTPDQLGRLINLVVAVAGVLNPPAEVVGVELQADETPGLILAELKKITAILTEIMGSVPPGQQLVGRDGPEWESRLGAVIATADLNAARERYEASAAAAADALRLATEQIAGTALVAVSATSCCNDL